MRQAGIVFLFIYLFTHTELHQVLRLPVLFVHYQDHKRQNKQIGFIDFVTLHYLSEDGHTDHERHRQMPFKGHDYTLIISAAILPENLSEPARPAYFTLKKSAPEKSPFASSFILFAIWQPPKA